MSVAPALGATSVSLAPSAGKRAIRLQLRLLAELLVPTLLLLWPAFVNGFPLVFADTGTYLRIATELYFPTDRPVVYGLLIAPFYLAFGLWGVVVAQAFLTALLVRWTVRAVVARSPAWAPTGVTALLALMTSAAWHASQIMPDIATGWVVLIIFLLWAPAAVAPSRRLFLLLLLAASIASHLSHAPLAIGLAAVAAITGLAFGRRRSEAMKASAMVAGSALVALLLVAASNLVATGKFVVSPDSHHFLVARLFDARLAQDTLASVCQRQSNLLCAHRPLLDRGTLEHPNPGDAYLWDDESPRATLVRDFPDRLEHDSRTIIQETIRSKPAAALDVLARGFVAQIAAMRRGDGVVPYPPEAQVSRQIASHFPKSAAAYLRSAQMRGTIGRYNPPWDGVAFIIAGLAALPIVWIVVRQRLDRLVLLWTLSIAGIAGNAFICSALSGIYDRYGSRIAWLLPLCAIVSVAVLMSGRAGPSMDTAKAIRGIDR